MARPADSIASLLAVADACARGVTVSPPAARWLVAGVRRSLRGGTTLDRAMGLSGAGLRAATRHALDARNASLRRAAELVGGPEALARELARFEAAAWPRWRHLGGPPPAASPLQAELWRAFAAGARVPGSSRQIRRIIGAP